MQSDYTVLPVVLYNPVHPAFHIILLHKSVCCILPLTVPVTSLIYKQYIEPFALEHIDILGRYMKRYGVTMYYNRPPAGFRM
ncbi:hypothetical protein D3C73_1026530 [compost metagenome]